MRFVYVALGVTDFSNGCAMVCNFVCARGRVRFRKNTKPFFAFWAVLGRWSNIVCFDELFHAATDFVNRIDLAFLDQLHKDRLAVLFIISARRAQHSGTVHVHSAVDLHPKKIGDVSLKRSKFQPRVSVDCFV